MILQELSTTDRKLSELVTDFRINFPASEEKMFKVLSPKTIYSKLEEKYHDGEIDHIDGLSVEYSDWRFNIRGSNTEPVVKMNVEAKTRELVAEKVAELESLIEEQTGREV